MTNRTTKAPPPYGVPEYDDGDQSVMSGVGFWLIAILAFLAITTAAVVMGTSKIEADIETRVTAALVNNGYIAVVAEASGTDVELYGTYSGDQSEDTAHVVAQSVPGVTGVSGGLWQVSGDDVEAAIISGAAIEFAWESSTVTVSGDISTDERRSFVSATLAAPFRSIDVDGFGVVEGLADESDWIGAILALVISSKEVMDAGKLTVVPSQELLVLTGDVDDKAVRNALNKEVAQVGDAIGFDTNAAVRVPELPPEAVLPTEEDVEALQVDLDALLLDKVVEFEVKSVVITDKGITLLDEVLEILRLAPEIRIEVAGHADTQGSTSANLTLSKARAAAVLAYIVAQGESPDRYTSIGYGDTRPVGDNNTDEGRARNRRIEFRAILEEAR